MAEPNSQPILVKVRFNIEPPESEVLILGADGTRYRSLGQAKNIETLELSSIRQSQGLLKFKFKAPLWFGQHWTSPEPESVEIQILRKAHRFPPSGTLDLSEQMPWMKATQAKYSLLTICFYVLSFVATALILFKYGRGLLGTKPPAATSYGDYLTTGVLGKGGMGVVYAAKSPNGDDVAIKSVLPALSEDQEFRKRFEREIKACIDLRHPNLLEFYGFGVDSSGSLYSVAELLKGQTLKSLLKSGEYDPPQLASDVIEQIGSALDYLHSQKLLHRDVKPDNIFVSETGQMKLMDLGLVRGEDLTVLTQTGNVLGTPAYMAPEQASNNSVEASDQYALGIVLYEILTRLRPFRQTKVELLVYQHTTVKPEPPSTLEPRVPEDVEAAILKMLEKRPSDRFASMSEAQAALSDRLLSMTWKEDNLETINTPLRPIE